MEGDAGHACSPKEKGLAKKKALNPRSLREEKRIRWSNLRGQLRDSKGRERKARLERQDRLALKRAQCAAAASRVKDDCATARAAIRAATNKRLSREKALRDEARADYRHATGQAAKSAPKGKRYSKKESNSLALHNVPDHLSELFEELADQFPYDREPDARAELFLEWVEEHPDEVVAWQAERYGGDEGFAASYAAYLEGSAA